MVADKAKLEQQISLIREYLKDIENLGQIDLDTFKGNRERQLAILHALQLCIEGCLNIGAHIIAADELGSPGDYAGIFDILANNNIVSKELTAELKNMAHFRNRIVHLYWKVDLDLVYDVMKNRLSDIKEYLRCVVAYLEK